MQGKFTLSVRQRCEGAVPPNQPHDCCLMEGCLLEGTHAESPPKPCTRRATPFPAAGVQVCVPFNVVVQPGSGYSVVSSAHPCAAKPCPVPAHDMQCQHPTFFFWSTTSCK